MDKRDAPALRQVARVLSVTLAYLVCSCYPERQAIFLDKKNLDRVTVVKASTKLFLSDGSVVFFPHGFQLQEGAVHGQGARFSAMGKVEDIPVERLTIRYITVPQDSTVAMTYFEEVNTVGRVAASVIHGIWGAVITPASIYCLANPRRASAAARQYTQSAMTVGNSRRSSSHTVSPSS